MSACSGRSSAPPRSSPSGLGWSSFEAGFRPMHLGGRRCYSLLRTTDMLLVLRTRARLSKLRRVSRRPRAQAPLCSRVIVRICCLTPHICRLAAELSQHISSASCRARCTGPPPFGVHLLPSANIMKWWLTDCLHTWISHLHCGLLHFPK